MRQDAEELLPGPKVWGTPRTTIEETDAEGVNVLSFDEPVILPLDRATRATTLIEWDRGSR